MPPIDLLDYKTKQYVDTLYFRGTLPIEKGEDAGELNHGLKDEAEDRFTYTLWHFVCFSLQTDPLGTYRMVRHRYESKEDTLLAAQQLALTYGDKAKVLNLMPFDEALTYYVRFI